MEPTIVTWILLIFGGVFIFLPIMYAQLLMILRPQSQQTKDLLIGKGEDWRDQTHLRSARGIAWADLGLWLPMILASSVGVALGYEWGYILWIAAGAISVYISTVLWFMEREYVYPTVGPLMYYTVIWGFFVYWGVAVVIYSMWRLS